MNYKIQIDGLRFFAVVAVLIGHWISWKTSNLILKNTPNKNHVNSLQKRGVSPHAMLQLA